MIAPPTTFTPFVMRSHPDHGPVIAGVDGMYSGCDGNGSGRCAWGYLHLPGNVPAENKVAPSKYAGRKVLSYEKADYYRRAENWSADTAATNNGSM